MSFSGVAFEKNFSVTARDGGESTSRSVSIKDRLGPAGGGGGAGGSGPSVSFVASPTNAPRLMSDRVGVAPRGGGRYSNHDDRTMPYNDYDRSDRGSYR